MEENNKKFTVLNKQVFDLQGEVRTCNLTIDLTEKAMKRVKTDLTKSLENMEMLQGTLDKISIDVDDIKKHPPSKYNRILAILFAIFVAMDGMAIIYGIYIKSIK